MLKTIKMTGLLGILAIATASIALGSGIPDLSHSVATLAYPGAGALSLFNLPDGSGNPLTQAYLVNSPGGQATLVDGTITLTLLDGNINPVSDFPLEDIWLRSTDGGMAPCIGGTNPDYNTDPFGQTVWQAPLMAGGSSLAFMQVSVNGQLIQGPGLPLAVNSADINGDLVVGLPDIVAFASDYFGSYGFRSDFHCDGALNLSDLGKFASGMGTRCP